MILKWSSIIGGALLVFALFGVFARPDLWVGWSNLVGAWFAFFIAADIRPNCSRAQRIGGPAALSGGLFVMWFVAFMTMEPPWLSWGTFAFACAFLLLASIRWIEKDEVTHVPTKAKEKANKNVA